MRMVPSPIGMFSAMKNDSSEAPTTTEGAAMSVNTSRSDTALPRNRQRPIASAIGVPSSTAIAVLPTAISSECHSAAVRSAMPSAWAYQ